MRTRGFNISRRALLRDAVLGGVMLTWSGCGTRQPVDTAGWHTALGTEYVLARRHWAPRTAAELLDAVRRAAKARHRIRMTGSGHSFSDVALSDDWLLAPTGLARMLPMDSASLRHEVDASRLVRVAAGLRVRELNDMLDARDLALENMGGFDGQTFVGAASTGTHGSGIAFGPLASQIVSIQVVGPDGELMQVEPENGVTDAVKFVGRLPEEPSISMTLSRDTELFNALAVGLGCMGVIYAVTLRAVPKFWLVEKRTLTTWERLIADNGTLSRLVRGEPIHAPGEDEPDHVEIYYTPYNSADGTHVALVTQRWRKSAKPAHAGERGRGAPVFLPEQALTVVADEFGILQPVFAHLTTAEIRDLHINGLRNMAQDYYADVSYRIFNLGLLNLIRTYGVELAFDLACTKEAVEQTFASARDLAAAGWHHSAPLSLRFVGPANAYLAMQHGAAKTMMEIGILVAAPGAEELLRHYEETLMRTVQARPHWGLDRNILRSESEVAALYPAWPAWKRAYDRMNPEGTFDGRITDRLGISHRPR